MVQDDPRLNAINQRIKANRRNVYSIRVADLQCPNGHSKLNVAIMATTPSPNHPRKDVIITCEEFGCGFRHEVDDVR